MMFTLTRKEVTMQVEKTDNNHVSPANSNSRKSNGKESTAKNLLKFAGAWKGDDLEKCLREVYKTRGETRF